MILDFGVKDVNTLRYEVWDEGSRVYCPGLGLYVLRVEFKGLGFRTMG